MCSVKLSMNAYTALRMSAVRIGPECTVAFDYQWALFELKSKCPTAAMPKIIYKDRGTNTWVRDRTPVIDIINNVRKSEMKRWNDRAQVTSIANKGNRLLVGCNTSPVLIDSKICVSVYYPTYPKIVVLLKLLSASFQYTPSQSALLLL